MNHPIVRWLLPILRYGLCAAAIVYLYFNVNWHDHVVLEENPDEKVRLLEERGEELLVLVDGEERVITMAEVHHVADGRVPEITYGIRGVVERLHVSQALLAILIFLPVPLLQSIRLVWMLAVQDVRLSYWNAIKLSYAGNFFNFALPGTTGGDLIKAYYITRYTHHKTEAVTTVFLDRVIGLLGLMTLGSIMFIIGWNRIVWDPTLRTTLLYALLAIWSGLLVGCIFVFSRRLRHVIGLPELAAKLPAADHLLRIGRATVAMRHHKSLVALSLANTLVLQLIVVIAAYVMARALQMNGDFTLFFIGVPIGFLIGAIPISPPQAFGVMEWAYVQMFTLGGLNGAAVAVAFALANRLTQLVWALPGVFVPLLGLHLPSQSELQTLEALDEDPDAPQSAASEAAP